MWVVGNIQVDVDVTENNNRRGEGGCGALEVIIKFVQKRTADGRRTGSVHDDDQKIQSCAMQVDADDFEGLVDRKWYGSRTVPDRADKHPRGWSGCW